MVTVLRGFRGRVLMMILAYAVLPFGVNHWGELIAASINRNLGVSATVAASCTPTAGSISTDIDLGTYDPTISNVPVSVTADFDLRCTKNSTAEIAISNGTNAVGTQRRMTDGYGNYLEYQVYQDAGHTVIWNETNTQEITATQSTSTFSLDLYVEVTENQDLPVGTYTDTISIITTY